ncbi:DMT family transporter [Kocuria sp. 2SI]|uniref:DMT family transporter n=1 Tax=Kocuria sp. 2SI TaxID=2502203 RepID=UPI0010FA2A63|nr:DMT family transporter [Kocuria sp. 2SI]
MNRGVGRAAAMGAVVDLDGIALMPVLLLTGAPLIASAQPMMVGIYMALVPMLLGYLLFGYGLTRVTPSAATTLTLAEPAIAALLAVVLVGERLPAIGWAGLADICASLLVISLAPATHACAAEPSRSRELPIRQEA